jgi:uncharacterized small protein (DUF1192 family)
MINKTKETPKKLIEQALGYLRESSENLEIARIGNAEEFREFKESITLTGADVRLGSFDKDYDKVFKCAVTEKSLLPAFRGFGTGSSPARTIHVDDAVLRGLERFNKTVPSARKAIIDDKLADSMFHNEAVMDIIGELAEEIERLEAENRKLKGKRLDKGAASLASIKGRDDR